MHITVPACATFANIAFYTLNSSGEAEAPAAAPVGNIYRVDPDTGEMALDVNLGAMGVLNFSPAPTGSPVTGWYQFALDLTNAAFDNYYILVDYTIGADDYNLQIDMFIDPTITSSAISANGIPVTPQRIAHISP